MNASEESRAGPASLNGVNKCLKCGASDVHFDGSWLVCAYCKYRWNTAVLADALQLHDGIESLVGTRVFGGAGDIDTSTLVTVECTGCGANVTLNTETTLSATCHWCRHVLSLNNPIDNGSVPDAILPFAITKDDALSRMWQYANERAQFASAAFKKDFASYPVHAVYLPYLVVDGNVTVRLDGRAWVDKGSSEVAKTTIYSTEQYSVLREVDMSVDDLAVEARSTRSRLYSAVSTTNIINSVQPFDVAHAMRFDASYIGEGIALERRDMEVAAAMSYAADHFKTMARGYVNQTLTAYTGGVRWESEQAAIKGTRWVSVLLPVWLYAFQEHTPRGPMMHYIAVNGRTGETQGSVPVDGARADSSALAWGVGASLVSLPFLALAVIAFAAGNLAGLVPLFLAGTAIVAGVAFGKNRRANITERQRNPFARLMPEFETKYTPTRLAKDDRFLNEFVHRGGPEVDGRNDHEPQTRAAYSRAFLAEAPPPPPTAVLAPQVEAQAVPQVTPTEPTALPLEGQQPSPP